MTKPTGVGRGGSRTNAGRPIGARGKTFWSPEQVDRFRALIQTDQIIKRLNSVATGAVDSTSPGVSAALGLLKKVMPDLTATETKTEVGHYVIEAPAPVVDISSWQNEIGTTSLPGVRSPVLKPN